MLRHSWLHNLILFENCRYISPKNFPIDIINSPYPIHIHKINIFYYSQSSIEAWAIDTLLLILMKLVTVFIIILLACEYPTAMSRKLSTKSSSYVNKSFQQWILEYGRTYSNTTEMNKHRQIFKEELRYVKQFNNAGNILYLIFWLYIFLCRLISDLVNKIDEFFELYR